MTIHQPSWAVFTKLDRVILLAQGSVFFDGTPTQTVAYFAGLGYKVPDGTNPADYFILIAENAERNEGGARRVRELIDAWKEHTLTSPSPNPTVSASAIEVPEPSVGPSTEEIAVAREWPTPWVKEFYLLFTRWYRESVSEVLDCDPWCIDMLEIHSQGYLV